ncbi:hypothetical protein BO99DRAFT_460216 [Aspergillus violaceofuscus CBS 115571]|uniref:Uncharacterized protein n=1 Tax=Aspergillus violaceofuscus (strain CBS 115571) TaxID=1450538 RepID=A0A2V5HP38_ASPV1|nr:hypothetical protein BO99DRAFT_460216 [Aspergillus violaceofuscus CBS 115571]
MFNPRSLRGSNPYDTCSPTPAVYHRLMTMHPTNTLIDTKSVSTIVLPSVSGEDQDTTRAWFCPSPSASVFEDSRVPFFAGFSEDLTVQRDVIRPVTPAESPNWIVYDTHEADSHTPPSFSHWKNASQSDSRPGILRVVSDPRTKVLKNVCNPPPRSPAKKSRRQSLGSYVSKLRRRDQLIKKLKSHYPRRTGRISKHGELPLPHRSALLPVSNSNQASGLGQGHSRQSVSSDLNVTAFSPGGPVQRTRQTVGSSRGGSVRSSLLAFWDWLVYAPENTTPIPTQQHESEKHAKYPTSQTPSASSSHHITPPCPLELKTFTTATSLSKDKRTPTPPPLSQEKASIVSPQKIIPPSGFSAREKPLHHRKTNLHRMAADKLSVQDPFQDPRTPERRYTGPSGTTLSEDFSMESKSERPCGNVNHDDEENLLLSQRSQVSASRSTSYSIDSNKRSRIPMATYHRRTPAGPSPLERELQSPSAQRSAIPVPVQKRSASSPACAYEVTLTELCIGKAPFVDAPSTLSTQSSEGLLGATTSNVVPTTGRGHTISTYSSDDDLNIDEETPKPRRTVYTGEYRTPVAERTAQRIHGPRLRISSSADEVLRGTGSQSVGYISSQGSDSGEIQSIDKSSSFERGQDGIGDTPGNGRHPVNSNEQEGFESCVETQGLGEETEAYEGKLAAPAPKSVLSGQIRSQASVTKASPLELQANDNLLPIASPCLKKGQDHTPPSNESHHDTQHIADSHIGSTVESFRVQRTAALHSHPVRSSSVEAMYEFPIQDTDPLKSNPSNGTDQAATFENILSKSIENPRTYIDVRVQNPAPRSERKIFSIRNMFKPRAGADKELINPDNGGSIQKTPLTAKPIRKAVSSKNLGAAMKPSSLGWSITHSRKTRTGQISSPIQIPLEQLPAGYKPLPGPSAFNLVNVERTLPTNTTVHTPTAAGSRSHRRVVTASSGSPYLARQASELSSKSVLAAASPSRIPVLVHTGVQTENRLVKQRVGAHDGVLDHFIKKYGGGAMTPPQRDTFLRHLEGVGAAQKALDEAIASKDKRQSEKEAAEEALELLYEQLEGFLS